MDKTPDHGIKAMLFDLNGVLVEGTRLHTRAFEIALSDAGYSWPSPALEYLYSLGNMTTLEKLEKFDELFTIGNRESWPDIVASKRAIMLKLIDDSCEPKSSTIGAIEYATSLMPCGVVTNCTREAAELMLNKVGLTDLISITVAREDVGEKIKPSPWPYILGRLTVAKDIGTRECLAFDNTDRGIISAVDAMCRTVRVKNFGDLTKKRIHFELNTLRLRI